MNKYPWLKLLNNLLKFKSQLVWNWITTNCFLWPGPCLCVRSYSTYFLGDIDHNTFIALLSTWVSIISCLLCGNRSSLDLTWLKLICEPEKHLLGRRDIYIWHSHWICCQYKIPNGCPLMLSEYAFQQGSVPTCSGACIPCIQTLWISTGSVSCQILPCIDSIELSQFAFGMWWSLTLMNLIEHRTIIFHRFSNLHTVSSALARVIRKFMEDFARPFCQWLSLLICNWETNLGSNDFNEFIYLFALEFAGIVADFCFGWMLNADIGDVAYPLPNHCINVWWWSS